MSATDQTTGGNKRVWTLERENELRFEVGDSKIQIKLIDGDAECFGTELAIDKYYSFKTTNGCIFTWHGAKVEIVGDCHSYIADETPMVLYINTHQVLHEKRELAKKNGAAGPRVMIVGATDSGKSSLCRILCNYSTRRSHKATFVDLDVGQGTISTPGMLAAINVDKPIDLEDGFGLEAPLVYYYGHTSPGKNVGLYKQQLARLAKDVDEHMGANKDSAAAGMIINTCGWVDGLGYQLLLYSIEQFKVDVVLVMAHERLYSDLKQHFKTSRASMEIIKMQKSGGVVTRDTAFRRRSRVCRIRAYFYGDFDTLSPQSTVISFTDFKIYRVGGVPQAPASSLPLGAKRISDPLDVVEVTPTKDITHSVLALCYANSSEDVLEQNIAGFLYVTEVNPIKRRLTVLAPCAGPLPGNILLVSDLKWLE